MSRILGITLARGGSKGVPGKHTRDLCGKPLIARTIEEAQKSKHLNEYIISSDDDSILDTARAYGVFGTIKRHPSLAQDNTPTLPALQDAVMIYENGIGALADYIIEIRATSPLKTVEDIDGIIKTLIESDADSVIGVTELGDHHPARAKWLSSRGYICDFIPEPQSGQRQDLMPKAYVRNGTVYALRRDALMGENGKLFGHTKSIGYVMPAERSVNIDNELDWLLCEAILRKRNNVA